jgi:hypothetical protein
MATARNSTHPRCKRQPREGQPEGRIGHACAAHIARSGERLPAPHRHTWRGLCTDCKSRRCLTIRYLEFGETPHMRSALRVASPCGLGELSAETLAKLAAVASADPNSKVRAEALLSLDRRPSA